MDDDDYRIKKSTIMRFLYEINERLIDLEVSQTNRNIWGTSWHEEEVRERIKNKYSYLELK